MIRKSIFLSALVILGFVSKAQNIVISEIHYNPADAGSVLGDELEFIEITNITTNDINISGYSFLAGISYFFGSNSIIKAGQSLVIAKNKAVFDIHYQKTAFGQYTGGLKNSGETVTFSDLLLNTVFEVTYSDVSPWSVLADGLGYSLELVDPKNPNLATSWSASANIGGTPTTYQQNLSTANFPIVVNEVLANTSGILPEKIELYNTSDTAVNVGGWYITDDRKDPKKYQIPAQTIINPKGYLVLTSTTSFGNAFNLSSKGEEVYIFSATDNTVTGYSNGFSFKVSDVDQSFGRHITSEGKTIYFIQTDQSFGQVNTPPKVGPLVITDIMYNPDILTDEFVIIKNISANAVSSNSPFLTDSNGIKISGVGYQFDFKNPTSFTSGESFILTSITPSQFRTKYKLAESVQIFQYVGALSNSSETISIEIPIYRDTLADKSYDNFYKVIDEVQYHDALPWATGTDGEGAYLKRTDFTKYANDPVLWITYTAPVLGLSKSKFINSDINIYPTLATNILNIDNKEDFGTYKIFNNNGFVLLEGTLENTIAVSNLPTGNYILQLINEEQVYSTSFIKK